MGPSASHCTSNDLRSPDPPLAALAPVELRQGDCIALSTELAAAGQDGSCGHPASHHSVPSQLYQVIGVDAPGDRCWLRRWPLARHGSPVFELPLRQLQRQGGHRPPTGTPRP